MTDPAKPLPCPWCGEQPKITKHFRENVWNLVHRCVVATIAIDWTSEEQIITRWNTHFPDPRLSALETTSKAVIAGLEAQIRDLKLELKMKGGAMSTPLSAAIEAIRAGHPEASPTASAMLDAAVLHQRIAELEARHAKAIACLKLIADYDGIVAEWCSEQARRTLEECG